MAAKHNTLYGVSATQQGANKHRHGDVASQKLAVTGIASPVTGFSETLNPRLSNRLAAGIDAVDLRLTIGTLVQ